MERKIIALALVIVLIAAGLAAGLIWLTGQANVLAEVRVGYITGDVHHLPYAIADNESVGGGKSIFSKHGLNVTPKGYSTGAVIMENGFAQNEVDIAYVGAAPAISKHLNLGKNMVNTSIISQVNKEGSLLIADNTIDDPSDLVGKKVAAPSKGTIQYLMLLKFLEEHGMNVSGDIEPYNGTAAYIGSVNYTDALAGTMKTLMQKPLTDQDHLSAFIAWEPVGSDAVAAGVGHVLATSQDIWGNHPCCVIVVSNSFAERHPDAVRKFISAHKEAIDWINAAKLNVTSDDYSLLVSITKSFTAKNETVSKSALMQVKYDYEITESFEAMLKEFTEKMIDFGIIKADRLTYNGNDYSNVQDFITRYVKEDYI
ncbi:MAG: ABC transporter substrate-binding protein [Thermoplasmata archaeon]